MKLVSLSLFLNLFSLTLVGTVENSILPMVDNVYGQDFEKRMNTKQKEAIHRASEHHSGRLRVMTYNMLYNAKDAEEKLPTKHRWEKRKPRLKEYLLYAQADLIGSQELQEDQVPEVMEFLAPNYDWYGVKTRENEGRSDINAIFFKKDRFELVEAQTIPYPHEKYNNAFTLCYLKDKRSNQKIAVINTKLTFGDPDRRLLEAIQLNKFSSDLEVPVILTGDFNCFPCIQDKRNPFLDGDYLLQILGSDKLKNAKNQSIYGHFGPLCSITNSNKTFEPFAGPQLPGFILDHIFVNNHIEVLTHGIDTAQVGGEFPSDHLPVIVDLYLAP